MGCYDEGYIPTAYLNMIDCWQYIFSFTEAERKRIHRLYALREWRTLTGVVAGLAVAAGVFLLQWPWAGEPHVIHVYSSYGATPAGILAGAWVRHWIPHYVHRRWMTVWHPIARERRAAHGWETLTPPAPLTIPEIIDRRWMALDKSGCSLLAGLGLVGLFILLGPAVDAYPWVRWPMAALLAFGWLAALLIGDTLGRD